MEQSNNSIIQFKYKYKGSIYDEVGVVGNLDILKNWNNHDPVKLSYSEEEKLFISPQLYLSKNKKFEYKYVFKIGNNEVWEDLPYNSNRTGIINDEPYLNFIDEQGDPNTKIERGEQKNSENDSDGESSGNENESNQKSENGDNLKILDYDFDDDSKVANDKEQKHEKSETENDIQKEENNKEKIPQQLKDLISNNNVIMCSFDIPFDIVKENGKFIFQLTNSPIYHYLYRLVEKYKDIKWFGSLRDNNYTKEEREEIIKLLKEKNIYVFNVDLEIYKNTKNLFFGIIEPLCHYITLDEKDMDNYIQFTDLWEDYKKYIDSVCESINPYISSTKKNLIFLHDYYFYLFPTKFQEKLNHEKETKKKISIGLYHHIPFPSYEIFKRIPAREEIVESLLKCQILGFHTFDDSRNFLKTSKRLLGANFVSTLNGDLAVNYLENTSLILVKNTTPDIDLITEYQNDEKFKKKYKSIIEKYKGKTIFVTMDYLIFPVTIMNKLVAYERFLNNSPNREQYVLILVNRSSYGEEGKEEDLIKIKNIVKGIQREFGENSVKVEDQKIEYPERLALLASANCFLRTTKQESFSLSVYEYLILKKYMKKEKESVIIISALSGVNTSLANTIKVNPFDYNSLCGGFNSAIQQLMQNAKDGRSDKDFIHAEKSSFIGWFYSFLQDLSQIKLTNADTFYLGVNDDFKFELKEVNENFNYLKDDDIVKYYNESSERLIFLDYEGTLPSEETGQAKVDRFFKNRKPNEETIKILSELTKDEKNNIYIVAGKDWEKLNEWFGKVPNLNLAAEHGSLFKSSQSNEYKDIGEKLDTQWVESCKSIIEPYVTRCEGSYLEKKIYSAVWQYSECDQELGKEFASVITSELKILLKNRFDVKIVNGKGFVEAKPLCNHKGHFVSYIIKEKIRQKKIPDFIMCIGDDAGDEKMFQFLKKKGNVIKSFNKNQNTKLISITVGKKPSEAEFYLNNPSEVKDLLLKLINK